MHTIKVKVCGLTRPEDALFCQECGVDFIGFVMAGESPRHISPEAVAAMPTISPIPPIPVSAAKRVGVFTSDDIAELEETAQVASLDYLQLHGGQSVETCRALGPERVIKVLWPERLGIADLQMELDRYASACAYFLFDAGKSGGGMGRPFAWEMLRRLDVPRPWFLAGGIEPGSAKDAAAYSPFALDVNSGVEISPGVKDVAKIRNVLRNLNKI